MIYRPLGSTGLRCSLIGLGTVKLGRNSGVKYPTAFDLPSDAQALELLSAAKELGINLIDTAPAYGESEARLGQLLPQVAGDWVICSKVGESWDGTQSRYDFTPEHAQQSIERSLRRLGRERLDVVLIHSNGEDRKIIENYGTLDALAALKSAGKIGAVGLSAKSAEGVMLACSAGADVVMATLNPDYLEEQGAIAAAGEAGVGVMVKKALASGHLGAQALSFVAAQAGVSTIVIGTLNTEHLRANCAAACG